MLLTAWLLLLLDGHDTHGYELAGRLAGECIGCDQSAVYRALRRLERDGDVTSFWAAPVAGPRRRLYRLTPSGRAGLEGLAGRIAVARDLNDACLRALARAPIGAVDI
jgi:DNA-binding PadR family transcriptional regulator